MPYTIEHLQAIATRIRRRSIEMITQAGSGHPGGALSSADIFTALFFGEALQYRAHEPEWEGRDRFILSAGHYSAALYATLAEAGYFPADELSTFRQLGARLQGHPHHGILPGIETSTGSLGQGFAVAVGLALAFRSHRQLNHVYCLMGDGEQDEGQVWEAAAAAAKFQLVNLICVIDANGMQENGPTNQVMPQGNLAQRYQDLGWRVQDVDGHNIPELVRALYAARAGSGGPQLLVAHTLMGKGVGFMERDGYLWHGKPLTEEQAQRALAELGEPVDRATETR